MSRQIHEIAEPTPKYGRECQESAPRRWTESSGFFTYGGSLTAVERLVREFHFSAVRGCLGCRGRTGTSSWRAGRRRSRMRSVADKSALWTCVEIGPDHEPASWLKEPKVPPIILQGQANP